jgi:ORF6N domain-containing protein
MLSTDLAALYGVEPRVLVQAVKRNLDRFPEDFMFQLTREELANLKSQIVISSWGGLRRASLYAFTDDWPGVSGGELRMVSPEIPGHGRRSASPEDQSASCH